MGKRETDTLNPHTNPDPLHFDVPDHTNWSRNNIAEALPGVCTALGFTFWFEPNNMGVRRGFRAVGACARSEVTMPERPDDSFIGAFFGQAAINLSAQQPFFDRVPLYSRGEMEAVMMSGEGEAPAARRRRPAFRFSKLLSAATMAWTALRLPRRQAALLRRTDGWWTRVVGAEKPGTIEDAVGTIVEAHDRFDGIMETHMATGLIMGAIYARLAQLAAAAGHPGLETKLVTGTRGIDETEALEDLWEVAHDRSNLNDFISRHGFHGTAEGQLSEPSWREDPSLLESLIEEMRRRTEDQSPGNLQRARERSRAEAARTLLAPLPFTQCLKARCILALSRRFVQLRETSKASFLRAIDAARCAARVLGRQLANADVIESAGDVFHLTLSEIADPGICDDPPALREKIAHRIAQRERYLKIELPFNFSGVPVPMETQLLETERQSQPFETEPAEADSNNTSRPATIAGMGVSPGIVQGRVRVLTSPTGEARIESGEILVCPMTGSQLGGPAHAGRRCGRRHGRLAEPRRCGSPRTGHPLRHEYRQRQQDPAHRRHCPPGRIEGYRRNPLTRVRYQLASRGLRRALNGHTTRKIEVAQHLLNIRLQGFGHGLRKLNSQVHSHRQ